MKYFINKRKITLIIISFVLLLIVIWKYTSNQSPLDIQETVRLSNTNTQKRPKDISSETAVLNIQTPKRNMKVSDPRKFPDTISLGAGVFSITTLDNVNVASYGIIFNEINGSFAIGLEKEPISQARLDAEQYLIDALQISHEDACELNVFVGVPYSVNKFYSGRNLGLSFCPGSVSLE